MLLPFPFTDLSQSKLRPAIALADAGRGDWILCQVTSNPYADPAAGRLPEANFASGSLRVESFARPGKLSTANVSLMTLEAGRLDRMSPARVIDSVVRMLRP